MNDDNLPVFQFINGKLVPKPGNKRDPNRRYVTCVGGPKGDYYREFTDEEERRADKEELNVHSVKLRKQKKLPNFGNLSSTNKELRYFSTCSAGVALSSNQ